MKTQRDTLRQKLYKHSKWGLKPTAVGIAIIGIVVLGIWAISRDASATSMLMFLTGISVICIGLIMYYLSPYRHIRSEVCDAISISNVTNLNKVLSSLLIASKGIYLPAGQGGHTKVFIPVSAEIGFEGPDDLATTTGIFSFSGKRVNGIVLEPPGQGLLTYSWNMGAMFTADGLEHEIKDLLENGLEIASKVNVFIDDNTVRVTMERVAIEGMCASVRREDPALCEQIGCPLCSFIACIVADGTGRKARIEKIIADRGKIDLTVELIGE